MLPHIEQCMDELADCIEGWAHEHMQIAYRPQYKSRWYKVEDLKSCYCMGSGDAFPCPHCMDYGGIDKAFGPALTAEYARHWRTIIMAHKWLEDVGPASGSIGHIQYKRDLYEAAYHLYAVSNRLVTVQSVGPDVFVADTDELRETRRLHLGAGAALRQQAAPAPQTDRKFVYQSLCDTYKTRLKDVFDLNVVSANAGGDCLLVTGGIVNEIVKAPCTAGYVPGEQTLVVKISAKELLKAKNRRDEQERVANEMLTQWMQTIEPVNDWLGAALDVPLMGHSMCSGIGYSQSPSYKRSGSRR